MKFLMNKCGKKNNLCKNCNENQSYIGHYTNDQSEVKKNSEPSLVKSLEEVLNNKFSQRETKFEKVIEKKLNEKINTLDNKLTASKDDDSYKKMDYAKVLAMPK